MFRKLSSAEVKVLFREAEYGAGWLRRRHGLSLDDWNDCRQDLLLHLLTRLDQYDPRRGSLGAFAGAVVRSHRRKLSKRLLRESARRGPSLDAGNPEGACRQFSEAESLAALQGQLHDRLGRLLTRLDLARAVSWLTPRQLDLCAALAEERPSEHSRASGRSRATLYRELHEIRMALLAAGFDPTV